MWEKTNKVLQEYAILVRNQYQDSLIKNNRIATGELLNSVEYDINVGEKHIKVSLNLPEYWKYVEHGRKPGKFPPPDKILEWVKIKPVLPYPDKNNKLPTPNQLSYLIGRKIATKGIEAGNQLQETLDEINDRFMIKIEEAVREDLNGMIGIITNFSA